MEGWLSEIGPYVVEDGQFEFNGTLNEWTWVNNASFIWIESPAGVGFSYVNWSNATFGDDITTTEQYEGLLSFYTKFPDLISNPLYISGESYAGIYIPRLAHWIVANASTAPISINLQGSFNIKENRFIIYYIFRYSSGKWCCKSIFT